MLLLTSTSDKLRLVTDAACVVDVHASWMEYDGTTVTPGRTNTAITTATTTDLVGSPASGKQRNVRTVHIRNKHATSSVRVTVLHTDGTTIVELHSVLLLAGDALEYIEGVGFFTLAAALPARILLGADQSNSTTTPTRVTGLSTPTGVGTFIFRCYVVYRSTALGTGVKLSMDYTGTVTKFVYNEMFPGTSALASDAAPNQAAAGGTATIMNAFSARAKSQAGIGTTVSVDTADADMLTIIEGLMVVTVAGSLDLWHGSEGAVQTTVLAGSSMVLEQIG